MIIEDDAGDTSVKEDIIPYQLSKEAIVLEMSVKDIKVCMEWHRWSVQPSMIELQ